jgi:uracil-DNA glycosylase
MLWGNYAQKKATFIDENKHLILSSVHPSPLSAYRGFLGCKHFSQCNTFLKANGLKEIDW